MFAKYFLNNYYIFFKPVLPFLRRFNLIEYIVLVDSQKAHVRLSEGL